MEQAVNYKVREVPWPRTAFLTKRAKLPVSSLPSFFSAAYADIFKAIKSPGTASSEPPFAIYYSFDEQKQETDVAAAVVLHEVQSAGQGLETVVIPAGRALLVTHFGPYDQMKVAYDALSKYASDHQLKPEWMLERYVSAPEAHSDPAAGETDIYFVLE